MNEELLNKIAKQYNIVPGRSMLQETAPELLPKPTDKVKNTPPRPTKEKGRPKHIREQDDIMELFDKCHKNGWSVAVAMIQHNLARRG